MITIDFLENHPDRAQELRDLWYEEFGRIWLPKSKLTVPKKERLPRTEEIKQENIDHSLSLPITLIAFHQEEVVGMGVLKQHEPSIDPHLAPWLGPLIVKKSYQKQGIGSRLINQIKGFAKKLGYLQLYLFVVDSTKVDYYQKFGFEVLRKCFFKDLPAIVLSTTL